MPYSYNSLAGRNVERIAALSDGIFGVGMTLLVLDLRVPAMELVHSDRDLGTALLAILPQLVMYMMSFLTLGIFWVGQQTQLDFLKRSDRHMTWIHFGFLFFVTITPFSTKLLAEFYHYRVALVGYWLNILLLGLGLRFSWGYAQRNHLLKDDMPLEAPATICRRISIAQGLYAAGALLCVIDTRLSIAAIVLVQLNYAIAPRFKARQFGPPLS